MSGGCSESKGLSAFARRRREWLLVGNEVEELLLFWGHSDASHPTCICQGVANKLPIQTGCCVPGMARPALLCIQRDCVLPLMNFLYPLELAGKGVACS